MPNTTIKPYLDAFRSLARRHLEKGSIDGLASLKQTLEMDNKAFADLLKPLIVTESPTVEPQKQPASRIDEVVKNMPAPSKGKSVAALSNTKPKNARYVVRLTVSPTNFLGFGLENTDTGDFDYKGIYSRLVANNLKPGDMITLNCTPRHGLTDLDYTKVGFDEDIANEYPYLEDLPVRHQPATGSFYVDVPAQNRTGAFRYYLSNEIVDKLNQRLGSDCFREGCLVTGFVISEKHFHITYQKTKKSKIYSNLDFDLKNETVIIIGIPSTKEPHIRGLLKEKNVKNFTIVPMSDTEQRFRLAMPKALASNAIVILNKSGINHAMGYDIRNMVTKSEHNQKFAVTETPTVASIEKAIYRAHVQAPADETSVPAGFDYPVR